MKKKQWGGKCVLLVIPLKYSDIQSQITAQGKNEVKEKDSK